MLFNNSTPKFAAQAIRKAYDIGWKPTQFLMSVATSVSAVMEPAGFEKGQGIITAQYLKDPTDPQWQNDPGMKDWLAFMKKYDADGNLGDSFNVYGYSRRANAGPGAEAVRRRSLARERHEAGGEAATSICRCCCRASASTPAPPTSIP